MTEQFDLSKHIVELEEGLAIHPDFVKEFIRELKEKIHNLGFNLIEATDGEMDRNIAIILDCITDKINELAGKELIEGEI